MLNYLERLRNKPEHERRKAVLRISVVATLIIAAIWGALTAMRVSSTDFSIKSDGPSWHDNMPSLADTFSNFFKEMKRLTESAEQATGTEATTTGQQF